MSSRREGSASPAATLVFNLRSLPRVRSPLKRISCEAKTYELKVVEVHVTNPFQTDVDLAVQLLPEMAEEPPKPKTPPGEDKKRRGNRANSPAKAKKASTAKTDDTEGLKVLADTCGVDAAILLALCRLLAASCPAERDGLVGQAAECLPLLAEISRSIRQRQVEVQAEIRSDGCAQGSVHAVEGGHLLLHHHVHQPAARPVLLRADRLSWAARAVHEGRVQRPDGWGSGETRPGTPPTNRSRSRCALTAVFAHWQTRDVELPFLNKHLEDAKRLFMEKHPSAKRKDQTNLIQAGFQPVASNGLPEPGGVPEVTYTVQQHNPNVEIAAPFVVLHEKPDEAGVTDTIKRPVGSATATGKSGRGGNGVPPNKIRLNLMPRGTGIYPVKVVLTSPYDVRTLLINFNAAVRGRASALSFDSPARKPVTQDIPLVNNGSSTLDVKARVQGGDAFSGPSAVQVPPKQTVPYPLCFCGPTAGEFTGKLELSIVKTGETNTYTLHGVAGEPVPDSHIVLEVAARTELVKKVQVHNPTKMTATFLVYSDLGFVSGREVVQVEGQSSKDYKMHLNPSKSGKYTGSITFASDEGLYVWHTLEVTVNEAAPEDRIQVSAAVRKAVSVILPVANPLPKPTTFDVVYMGPGVMGLPKLEVPASSSTDFEFYFAPLSEGVDMGRVQFINSELGEFWYELLLTGHPPDAVQVPQMRAPLCGRASRVLTVPNPTNEEVMYTVSSSNPRAFSVSTEHIIVPALGEAQFSVEYCPTTLSSAETATIRLNSMAAGQWDYECVGVADLPEVQEEVTMASIPGSSGSGQVVWRNPTAETATIDVSIRPASANEALIPGVFSMIDRRVSGIVLEPSQEVALAVNFSPPDLRNFRALVVLSVQIPSQREPILVKFPVFGAAETPSTVRPALDPLSRPSLHAIHTQHSSSPFLISRD